ncbi:MAG: pyridoxal-phosphate dependent enzyme [Lewinellaceae bacterium]|nr:pyridoxal-phosphate dependent enzyme [Lewinellaceae bacterium]
MNQLHHIPTAEDIRATHEAIRAMTHHTPVLTCESINKITGAWLFFKCENFQKVGAFKMRGAASAALRLSDKEKERGLATHSSGNHAQAVALSAKLLGIPAYIVMPDTSPAIKKAATQGYGAEVILCENTLAARERTLEKVVARTGATFIHPYNDYNVIAGQATAAKELLEDTKTLDCIIAPVGGGGLMSGTALSARYCSPGTLAYGAEPKAVDDAYRSFKSGTLQENSTIDTIADGLRTNLGEKTFDIIQRELEDIFTVSEEAIIAAMRLVWERMKIVIEPSCAVPLAAVLANRPVFEGKKVGVILTGGNVDLGKLPF